jgi:tetratricopeptide (TPR) repeat protein
MVLAKLGNVKEAEEHLQTSVRLDPEQYMAHTSLGELLAKQEKLTEARSHFEQALRIAPDYAPARKSLAAMSAASAK